jgi:hypothetical protein
MRSGKEETGEASEQQQTSTHKCNARYKRCCGGGRKPEVNEKAPGRLAELLKTTRPPHDRTKSEKVLENHGIQQPTGFAPPVAGRRLQPLNLKLHAKNVAEAVGFSGDAERKQSPSLGDLSIELRTIPGRLKCQRERAAVINISGRGI